MIPKRKRHLQKTLNKEPNLEVKSQIISGFFCKYITAMLFEYELDGVYNAMHTEAL